MSLIDDLDRLDRLILEHSKPGEAANLKNQASRLREAVEALIADNDRLTNELKVSKNTSDLRIEELERLVLKLEDEASKSGKPRAPEEKATEMPEDAKAILGMLARGGATVAEVADHFNHSPGKAEHYLEILRSRNFVSREAGVLGGRHARQARYRITLAGREWLETHGFVL
jgi:Bacterial regulatory protein, arsR family